MPIEPIDAFVPANGLRLRYRSWQPPAPGSPRVDLPPILLLHGLASSLHIWNLVAPLLAARGYVVTALDQRGHGESEKPDSGYDFDTIIADDRAAISALEIERPVLVGHSWGAGVALQYAATYPDLVTALVLVDGATNQFAPRLDFENHLQVIGAMWDQPTFELYSRVRCPLKLIVAELQPASEQQKAFLAMRREGIALIQELCPTAQIVRMADTIHDIPLQRPRELAEEITAYAPPQT